MKKRWYDYLWLASAAYLLLGCFNILFAWLGLLCFAIPLLISLFGGGKAYCGRYCGRGQLFALLGGKLGLSPYRDAPKFLRSRWFRLGFLAFFMAMFSLMLWNSWQVFAGTKELSQFVKLFWTFKLPWQWAYHGAPAPWTAQFAYGFYSLMLTSTALGMATMFLFKPRSWCVYCPMGTMTQLICEAKAGRPGRL